MEKLVQDLLDPDSRLVETHISRVVLREQDVYKLKKPVDLGFLDFTTREKRREACEAEVRLNRRLAPGVYRGVVPITRDDRGRHRIGGSGEPVDWAVHMTHLAESDRADVLLTEGRLEASHLERLAERLATFHAEARCDEETSRFGTVDAISGNVRENFEQTRGTIDDSLRPTEADEVEAWQRDFLARHQDRFEARRRSERVRDGHGDLRLEHVYLGEGDEIVVVDCIEFNQRFRFADVCADIAFLAMDLAWHGHPDLAERFLAFYARAADDYQLYPMVDFYESYRAFVRGKIATMVLKDPDLPTATRERLAAEARRYFLLALASERRALLPPRLIAVGGVIAAGKSTVAEELGARLSAPVLEADRTRKALLEVPATRPLHEEAWSGAYSPEVTARVYAELAERAGAVLTSGRSAILDASFRSRDTRAAARRLAERHGVPFLFVECRAEKDILKERLRRREHEATVSDGRLEIFDDFIASWQPVDELPEGEHLVLDTAEPLEDNLERVRERLGEVT